MLGPKTAAKIRMSAEMCYLIDSAFWLSEKDRAGIPEHLFGFKIVVNEACPENEATVLATLNGKPNAVFRITHCTA